MQKRIEKQLPDTQSMNQKESYEWPHLSKEVNKPSRMNTA